MERTVQTRIHDLREVFTDFKLIHRLIQSGYTFNDADAPAVLSQLEKALALLEKEITSLQVELK